MNQKLKKTLLGGLAGTTLMTAFMHAGPLVGMSVVSTPEMLACFFCLPLVIGWFMHTIIGAMFALIYAYGFVSIWKTGNILWKGAVYGVIIFIFAQLVFAVMSLFKPLPNMDAPAEFVTFSSLTGHVLFGLVLSKILGYTYASSKTPA